MSHGLNRKKGVTPDLVPSPPAFWGAARTQAASLCSETRLGLRTQESPGKTDQSYVGGPPPCSRCILLTRQLSSSILNAILFPPFSALRCLIPTEVADPGGCRHCGFVFVDFTCDTNCCFFPPCREHAPVSRPASGSVWWLLLTPDRASEFSLVALGVQVALVHGARLPQGLQAFCLGHHCPRKLGPVSPTPGLCFPSTSVCPRPSTEHAWELCLLVFGPQGSPGSASLAVPSGYENFVASASILSPGLFRLKSHSVVFFVFGFS